MSNPRVEVVESVDDRSPTAQALSTVSSITAISLMMIVPAIIGYFIDQWLGTVIVFAAIGLVLGVGSSIWQLAQFIRYQERKDEEHKDEERRRKIADDQLDGDR